MNLNTKASNDSLESISAVVKRREECNTFEKYNLEQFYDSDEDIDTEPDDEEHQCSVCKTLFVGEAKYEQHRRTSEHWG